MDPVRFTDKRYVVCNKNIQSVRQFSDASSGCTSESAHSHRLTPYYGGTLIFFKEDKSLKMKLPQVSKYQVSSLSGPLVVNEKITEEPFLL